MLRKTPYGEAFAISNAVYEPSLCRKRTRCDEIVGLRLIVFAFRKLIGGHVVWAPAQTAASIGKIILRFMKWGSLLDRDVEIDRVHDKSQRNAQPAAPSQRLRQKKVDLIQPWILGLRPNVTR